MDDYLYAANMKQGTNVPANLHAQAFKVQAADS